jgi:hypothetical protein
MRRHLTRNEASAALHRGSGVAQFLGYAEATNGRPTFNYVVVSGGEAIQVFTHHVFEPDDPHYRDVGEFAPVEAGYDMLDDEPALHKGDPNVRQFDSVEWALSWVEATTVALPDRWVNESLIGDEYADARALHRA